VGALSVIGTLFMKITHTTFWDCRKVPGNESAYSTAVLPIPIFLLVPITTGISMKPISIISLIWDEPGMAKD